MSGDDDGDELKTPRVPVLYFGNNKPLDEAYVLGIHTVAKATVDALVRTAVEDLTRAGATQWLADAVRGELISQAVTAVEPSGDNPIEVKEEQQQSSPGLVEPLRLLTRPSSIVIRSVARATVDAVTDEAVKNIVQAVEKASEWISQAVAYELVSESVDSGEDVTFRNTTESIKRAVCTELVAHAVAEVIPSNASNASEEQEIVESREISAAHDVPRLAQPVIKPPVPGVREIAKKTIEAAVSKALENVAREFDDVVPSDAPPNASEEQEIAETPEVAAAPDFPRLSLQVIEPFIPGVHAIAKVIAEAALSKALKNVARAINACIPSGASDASKDKQIAESPELPAAHNVPPLSLQVNEPSVPCIPVIAKKTVDAALSKALENVARAINAVIPSGVSNASEDQKHAEVAEVAAVHDVPRLSLQVNEPSVPRVREIAEATVEAAVSKARENVAHAIDDASQWPTQAVRGELLAKAGVDASPEDEPHIDAADNNFTRSTNCEGPEQPLPSTEETEAAILVPPPRIPNAARRSPETVAECHELAVPFVNEVVSSVLTSSPEPQEYADDGYEDYTPINSPTTGDRSSESPLSSTRPPEQDTQFDPPVIQSGRATPPDTNPTPRRSPITTKRGLGTPTAKENPPSSAPPALPSPRVINETPAQLSEPSSATLPPLVLPGVQLSGKTKHHQHHKPQRKTPRQSSSRSNGNGEEIYTMDTSRSSSSRLNKLTPRASIAVELSSARAAAVIYAQQPPSSRHHHHKPKKTRDSASQTSPPSSSSPTSLPRQPLAGALEDTNGNELPKTQVLHSKHSPRELPSPEKGTEKRGNNILLAPLSKTPAKSSSDEPNATKSLSPSRTHRNSHKGHSGGSSPNKRSGYCQRCVFEGRSCKINDCLKHQILK